MSANVNPYGYREGEKGKGLCAEELGVDRGDRMLDSNGFCKFSQGFSGFSDLAGCVASSHPRRRFGSC